MSAVAEIPALRAVPELSEAILNYLRVKGKAHANEIIKEVERQFPSQSDVAIVTAIWRLSDDEFVRIGNDWVVQLTRRP
jgi:predicted transcriptional regulator